MDFGLTAVLGIASAAMSAAGAVAQGNAQQASFRQQAAGEDFNAQVAKRNAQTAWDVAGGQEELIRRRGRLALGREAAATAQSGIDPGSGSALLLAHQSESNVELDALLVRHRGALQAMGYNDQATTDEYNAAIARSNARGARTAMYWNLVGVGANAAGRYASRPSAEAPYDPYGLSGSAAYGAGRGLTGGAGPW
jgi:hypothetical protein